MALKIVQCNDRLGFVVVVDDHQNNLDLVERILRHQNLNLLLCRTQTDLSKILATHANEISAALLDINLGGKMGTGVNVGRVIRGYIPNLPIVYMSAQQSGEVESLVGSAPFIHKGANFFDELPVRLCEHAPTLWPQRLIRDLEAAAS